MMGKNRNNEICFVKARYIIGEYEYKVVDHITYPNIIKSARSLNIVNMPGEYSRIPLFQKKLLVYTFCEDVLNEYKLNVKKALVLGGGGCSIPIFLEQNYNNCQIEVIEKNKEIIKISKKYFLKKKSKVNLICKDARKYIFNINSKECKKGYDFVFFDLFDRDKISELTFQKEFQKELMVNIKGIIVINLGRATHIQEKRICKILNNIYKFKKVCYNYKNTYIIASNFIKIK